MNRTIKEFTGVLKFTPQFGKCDPLHIYGHWVLKDIGRPYLVWCNDNIYRNGITRTIAKWNKRSKTWLNIA